jgi:hypothetical protein
MTNRRLTRRNVFMSAGAVGIAGLAGCTGDDDRNDTRQTHQLDAAIALAVDVVCFLAAGTGYMWAADGVGLARRVGNSAYSFG